MSLPIDKLRAQFAIDDITMVVDPLLSNEHNVIIHAATLLGWKVLEGEGRVEEALTYISNFGEPAGVATRSHNEYAIATLQSDRTNKEKANDFICIAAELLGHDISYDSSVDESGPRETDRAWNAIAEHLQNRSG